MLDLKALLSKILGCCYTKGTSGNWTYRKYLDGTLECWYHGGTGAYTVGTARGSLYSGGNMTYTYPVAFAELPSVTCGVTLSTDSYVVWAQEKGYTKTDITIRIVSSGSIAQNSGYTVHIHAIGKWGGN